MSSNLARDGRRRRVLHEEVRTASGLTVAGRTDAHDSSAEAPRYGEQANIEHHPQITDYVPRRKRALLVTLAGGLGVAAGAAALAHFAAPVAAALPGVAAEHVGQQLAGGVVAWTSAIALVLSAALARIIYSLRRHRVDDFRGRYRVWRWIGWAAVLASVNAVVQVHDLVARLAVGGAGWSLTATGAEWWLVPIVAVATWIAVRLTGELAESRSSLAAFVAAATCYAAAAAGALGWSPSVLGAWSGALTLSLPLAGHILALASLMLFARYVVLDVQGLIDHKPRASADRQAARAEKAAAKAAAKQARQAKEAAGDSPATLPAARTNDRPGMSRSADRDVDHDDQDEEDGAESVHGLSKSERKRLRKLQQRQSRAA